MKKLIALLFLLAAMLPVSAATQQALATAPRTNESFMLADTNIVIVGSGSNTWALPWGWVRSNFTVISNGVIAYELIRNAGVSNGITAFYGVDFSGSGMNLRSNAPTTFNLHDLGSVAVDGGISAVNGITSDTLLSTDGDVTGVGGNFDRILVSAIGSTIWQPEFAGSGPPKLVINASNNMVKWVSTGDVFYAHCSNGVSGVERTVAHWIYGGATNRSIVFPTGWTNNTFGCTMTNTLISNRWTVVYFSVHGATADANGQTNVFPKLESQ